jgi:hypothetical protein
MHIRPCRSRYVTSTRCRPSTFDPVYHLDLLCAVERQSNLIPLSVHPEFGIHILALQGYSLELKAVGQARKIPSRENYTPGSARLARTERTLRSRHHPVGGRNDSGTSRIELAASRLCSGALVVFDGGVTENTFKRAPSQRGTQHHS